MVSEEFLGGADDVLRLVVEETGGADDIAHFGRVGVGKVSDGGVPAKELRRHHIHALVGALRG